MSSKKEKENDKLPKEINGVLLPSEIFFKNIKNRDVRRNMYMKMKRKEEKEKAAKKKKKQSSGDEPVHVQKTIESLREPDETVVDNLADEDNKEIAQEVLSNEYASYFSRSYEPKVLITFGDYPAKKTMSFGRELQRIIPNALCRLRKRYTVKDIVAACNRQGYTDILIINENLNKMNGLMVIHLPEGPTANFRLSNVKVAKDLKRNFRNITEHRPEVILNNFTTRLGNSVASMLAALFHYEPEFVGKRAVTFHNQRDYIFFRHHRYEFRKNGEKVGLQELGPRFTLKLRWLQAGVFDGKTAEYDWIISGRRHQMETSRRKFFL